MSAIESPSDAKKGLQLVQTDYYGLGGSDSIIQHVHCKWDNALAAVITIWSSDLPEAEVALNSVVAGDWIQEDPPSGYTAVSPAGAATTPTPLTPTIPGGTAGGCSLQIGNIGSKRLRCRVVCTVQGQLRIRVNGKD